VGGGDFLIFNLIIMTIFHIIYLFLIIPGMYLWISIYKPKLFLHIKMKFHYWNFVYRTRNHPEKITLRQQYKSIINKILS